MKKYIYTVLLCIISLYSIAQNTGIGTNNPRSTLHVFNGFSGNVNPFSPFVVEGNNNSYINILTPTGTESGVLFGNTTDAASGGIVYNSSANFNGFQFRTNGNITRMVLTSGGNLGIDVPGPVEKLEVNGSIKAASFKYNTPKTHYYSIPGSAFRSENSNDTVLINLGYGSVSMFSVLSFKRLMAPVQLPQNAVLQNMTAYISDNSSSNVSVVFFRKVITSNFFPDNIGSITSSGSGGGTLPYSTPLGPFPPYNIIDNVLNSYYISISSTGNWAGGIMDIVAIVIEYTLSEG